MEGLGKSDREYFQINRMFKPKGTIMSSLDTSTSNESARTKAVGDLFTSADNVDAFEIEFNMDPRGRRLTFTLEDFDRTKPGTGRKLDGTATLSVPANTRRIFKINLSNDWDWEFAAEPVEVTAGDNRHYGVRTSANNKSIEIHARPTGKNPGPGEDGQDDKLDFVVVLKQRQGRDVTVRIDPITENPPPGGNRPQPTGGPAPLA